MTKSEIKLEIQDICRMLMAIEKAVDVRRTITIDGQDYLLEPFPAPDLKIPDVSNGAQWNPKEVGRLDLTTDQETPDAPVLPYAKLSSEVKPEEEVKFEGVKSGTSAGKIPKSVKGSANTNPVYQRPNTRI